MLLLFLKKKFMFGSMGHFSPENNASSELWICFKDFFRIFHNEGGQEVHENYIKLVILAPKMTHGHNSGSTLKVF